MHLCHSKIPLLFKGPPQYSLLGSSPSMPTPMTRDSGTVCVEGSMLQFYLFPIGNLWYVVMLLCPHITHQIWWWFQPACLHSSAPQNTHNAAHVLPQSWEASF